MPEVSIASLLFQAGTVAAFIIYALARDRREQDERKTRDKAWQDLTKSLTSAFTKALEDRDKAMKEALSLDRDQRKEGMDAGKGFVGDLASAVERLTDGLTRHEALAEGRHARTLEAIQAMSENSRRPRGRAA